MGDAVRAANAYLSLSRFEDQRPETLVAGKEVVMNPSAFRFATVPNVPLIGYLMDAEPESGEASVMVQASGWE